MYDACPAYPNSRASLLYPQPSHRLPRVPNCPSVQHGLPSEVGRTYKHHPSMPTLRVRKALVPYNSGSHPSRRCCRALCSPDGSSVLELWPEQRLPGPQLEQQQNQKGVEGIHPADVINFPGLVQVRVEKCSVARKCHHRPKACGTNPS